MRRIGPLVTALCLAGLAPTAALARPPATKVGVVERVVAVVDREIILLSELRERARPFDDRIAKSIGEGETAKRVAAEAQVRVELLDKLIDERIEAKEAKRLHLEVASAEIDRALDMLAQAQKLTVPELLRAAERDAGLGERAYREELARQILEGKLLQLRVRDRIKDLSTLTDAQRNERLEKERRLWLDELRADTFVEKRL